ncbi:MAG: IS1634 family transposase [Ktedonobacteraceae bacterium]
MSTAEEYQNERLDHLGIVAGVCQEIGLAQQLDALAPEQQRVVSYGTATVAMILNGLGFSNRQLYLVPQFFENKPVEHLLGKGITADMLNDDCLGRTLDWLYAHDPTTLFAGIAKRARRLFEVPVTRLHVDTTSFSVTGAYSQAEDTMTIAITYGYSKDHRADLKQWMLALATTQDGDIPVFMQPLNGNSSDKVSLPAAIHALHTQLQESHEPEGTFVADSGVYSTATMQQFAKEGLEWISRVPETMKESKELLDRDLTGWQQDEAQGLEYLPFLMPLDQRTERWVVVRTKAGLKQAQVSVRKQVDKQQEVWSKRMWHLSKRTFETQVDAQQAWLHELKGKPEWMELEPEYQGELVYTTRGRPSKDSPQVTRWTIQTHLRIDEDAVERQAKRKACFIVATNILDTQRLSDPDLIGTYKEQGGVERGFRFLKDPLFLASSVFVKKTERLVALSFIMVLCLLVYRLAEHRVRTQLAQLEQTIPNQINKPTARPTMRWIFQCFEGIELLHISRGSLTQSLVLRLQPVHRQILSLLGPPYLQSYFFSE